MSDDLPEYLIKELSDAEDIFNVLCLVYNERSHDAFRAAVERIMENKFECTVLDNTEFAAYESDSRNAAEYWQELEKYRGDNDVLRDQCRSIAERLRFYANEIEP